MTNLAQQELSPTMMVERGGSYRLKQDVILFLQDEVARLLDLDCGNPEDHFRPPGRSGNRNQFVSLPGTCLGRVWSLDCDRRSQPLRDIHTCGTVLLNY